MSNVEKKLMIRVINRRMGAGETFEEIIADYPKLTEAEVEELREALEETE